MNTRPDRIWRVLLLAGAVMTALPSQARAQDKIGGHFGIALPLITNAQGQTTTIGDDFVVVFPMGITVKRSDRFAFDLELAPAVQNDPRHIDLTVHPGLIYGIGHGLAVGGRLAFGIDGPTWGFTPLLNRGLLTLGDATVFGELDLPVRFKEDSKGAGYMSVGLAVVFGIAF